jgi:hypothetical protein
MREREEKDKISGGRFVQPAADQVLPPIRATEIQGGRFVQPAANGVLPPTRSYQIQAIGMEPGADPPFHIGALNLGVASITNVRIRYPWNASSSQYDVTSVPVGEPFALIADYSVVNSVGGISDMWSVCIVWWDASGDITLDGSWFRTCSSTVADGVDARLTGSSGYLIMPNHNVTLYLNMFVNDDHAPSQQYPPRADWNKLRI